MELKLLFNFFLSLFFTVSCYSNERSDSIKEKCPRIYEKSFKGLAPKGNKSAGVYEDVPGITKLKNCVLHCCQKSNCNVAFINDNKCYHIECASDDLCVPSVKLSPESAEHLTLILVNPKGNDSWEEVLRQQDFKEEMDKELMYSILNDRSRFRETLDLLKEEAFDEDNHVCELGISGMCSLNEVCMPQHKNSRIGICECLNGYVQNANGECYPIDTDDIPLHSAMSNLLTERVLETSSNNNSIPVTRKPLIVKAESKKVRLPENEATLFATVEPASEDQKCQFDWTTLHQPEGSTAVQHKNEGKLHLEKLSEGIYAFKVSAFTPTAFGETFVNVTVLPAKRQNTPPVIIITPANQTIKQPNSAAVLDASSSTDDDGIIAWHWELQQGPLGYEPKLKDSPTLQLNDLTKPGNYSFKLTVTDTDHETSSEVANISVLAGTDYPPEANAGADKIIYLPHNSIVLNGNLSTDDHAITTWEWTKSPDNTQKAVDMQDTRTPYLKLSNLVEGMYTFTLKVTDSANQSSTAQVHVFVKPPTNKPPIAVAGPNLTISLPQTWVVLDASGSTDDNKILNFKWKQIEGPSTVTFENVNASKTNVTGLTKGLYLFKVNVTDDSNNMASDKVYVTVNQNQNQKPTANAGFDFDIEMPVSVVTLNGSNSADDWAIVKWKWTKDPKSLAVGNIVEATDQSPILLISDVTVGKYIFNLTVYDEQGLSDTDTVIFNVKRDPKLFHLIEITVNVDANSLTEAQYTNLKGKLALLINEGSTLQVRTVRPELGTGRSIITFYVFDADGKTLPANDVVRHLRQKLRIDASLLGFSIAKLQTAICQNNCSGHGVCDEQTRKCKCEVFWMQDMFKVYMKFDEDSDCNWSILYVVLGAICSALLFLGTLWGIVHLCYTWCSKKSSVSKPSTYKLIEDTEDLPPFSSRKNHLSDSDTDSDVVFESRAKSLRFSDTRNGRKPTRNGFAKLGGRVKT